MIIKNQLYCKLNVNFSHYCFLNIIQSSKRFKMNNTNSGNIGGVLLKTVIDKLSEFAPPSLAESWDNVGLLLEPANKTLISRILLTNDLTEDVMEEAIQISANLIISYHPPLFAPFKRLTNATWKERIVIQCLANNIAVYSPHTSWDIVQGGVTDWLASAFKFKSVKPLFIHKDEPLQSNYILTIESSDENLLTLSNEKYSKFLNKLESDFKILISEKLIADSRNMKFTIQCSDQILNQITPLLQEDTSVACFYVNPQHMVETSVSGMGRMCKLETEITIRDAVETIKKHIGTPFVQLALARKNTIDSKIKTIAFVAGSGGSVMKNIYSDLKITGEASHHDVLHSVHCGSSVILTNHSNSERGFLSKFKEILASMLNNPSVSIAVSSTDSDPLNVV